ncbi:MAG: cyanoexosortase A [Oculatellaceae cyanobacterium bins.114]|nr:cyanoexosortase A [Oculatellaceae cyanobacterium bins.114]
MVVYQGKESQVWLSIVGVGIVALHLVLTWRLLGQTDQLVLNLLLWGAIASLLWQRRSTLILKSDRWATLIGLMLFTLLLCKSLSLFWFESAFVRVFPGLATLGWALLASGFRLQQYGREFCIVFTLMLPQGLLAEIMHQQIGSYVQVWIAQIATFLLHYGGVDVVRHGVEVVLGQKAVAVEYACTGMPMLILLLQLSVVLLLVFPISLWKQVLLVVIAIVTAFSLSSIRVAVMALVVNHPSTFDYWHGVQGSQIFTTLAIGLFILSHHYFVES